jgi:PAS domain S-box-containing protein
MRIGTRIAIGVITALAVVALISTLSASGASHLIHAAGRVDHTNALIRDLDEALSSLIGVQTGVRGYVITGQPSQLEPYDRGRARLRIELGQLRAEAAGDPALESRLGELERAVDDRLRTAEQIIDTRRTRGFEAAAAQIRFGMSRSGMDQPHRLIAEIRGHELRLLSDGLKEASRRGKLTLALILAGGVGMALFLLIAAWALSRSITRPLGALARGSTRLVGRHDEIGALARALEQAAHERARAEASRRELLDDAPEAFFLADLNGRYTDVNKAACELLGYSRQELLSKTILDLIKPEDAERLAAERERMLTPGTSEVSEWFLRGADGEYIPVEVNARILSDGRWQAFAHDLRDRKRHEEELRLSEERFRLALDEAPTGMAMVSLEGRILRINAAFCELLGRDQDEMTGSTFLDITHPDDRAHNDRLVGQLRSGEIATFELKKRYVRKDGSIVPVVLHASVVRRTDGTPLCMIGQIEDLTQRQRLEVIRESALGISELVPGQTLEAVLRSIVDEARNITGASFGALGIGTDPSQPFDPWVVSGVDEEDSVERLQLPIHRHGRSVGTLYLAKPPGAPSFGADDRVAIELLGTHAAIAIENARLYEQLTAALRARQEMVAVVSHDLKNPLGAISLRAQMLELALHDPVPSAHVASIRRAIASMLSLIRQLLDAERLEAGSLRLDLEDHDLRSLTDDVVELIEPVARSHEVQVDHQVEEGLQVRCDRERICQVLSNLLGNAVKFSPPGGRVMIRAWRAHDGLRVAVRDQGSGVSYEDQPRLFDRYFTTARGAHGAGLGLYIVKGFVEAHGGRVWLESVPGRGATFFFTLPERLVAQPEEGPRASG